MTFSLTKSSNFDLENFRKYLNLFQINKQIFYPFKSRLTDAGSLPEDTKHTNLLIEQV